MPTQTVRALENLQHRQMLVVTRDAARAYTGAGTTTGGALALACEDIPTADTGPVDTFITLDETEQPAQTAPEKYETRVFDAQIGRLWGQLSVEVNRLCKNQRGRSYKS